uniref:Sigma-70 family RNA polymerase sigma factor n=1 Tax=Roseihalotalea indica TaxID=2867963 RepID=A0AA49GLX5_9BACT|nr:sigma-70 family RNA polymerase sigma factor [Tunicatimonas sp. TK19036]
MSLAQPDNILPLIQGCIDHQRDSQQQLYQQFYGYGMSICLRYTRNEDEAIEVLNDGFMKVYQGLKGFDTSKSFPAWFRRILINTAINHYHKTKKYQNHEPIESQVEVLADDSNIISRLSYEEIFALIQQLSPMYRTVFNLYVIDGYTHEEISEALGISIGTSKSNLSRARAQLRVMLKKNERVACKV